MPAGGMDDPNGWVGPAAFAFEPNVPNVSFAGLNGALGFGVSCCDTPGVMVWPASGVATAGVSAASLLKFDKSANEDPGAGPDGFVLSCSLPDCGAKGSLWGCRP